MPTVGWEMSTEYTWMPQNTRQCLGHCLRLLLTQNCHPVSFTTLPASNPVLFLESQPRSPLWQTWAHCSLLLFSTKYLFWCSYTTVIQLYRKLKNCISWASTVFFPLPQHHAKEKPSPWNMAIHIHRQKAMNCKLFCSWLTAALHSRDLVHGLAP